MAYRAGVLQLSATHSGSCLCGEVRFAVCGSFDRFYLCHCSHCRKDTGSAHAANLFSATAELQWLAGERSVQSYGLAGTRHRRCFCRVCGSALPYQDPGLLVVPAGSLDSELSIRPDAHIFTASRAGWDEGLENVPAWPQLPRVPG